MTDPVTAAVPGSAFSERHVVVDGFTVRYCEAGTGDPIVSVHGAGGLTLTFAMDLLADAFRVIAVELPGFGTSEINDRTQDTAEMASTLAAFMAAVDAAPAHVWGTSMGGVVCTHLAVEHPEVVRSLVLEGPGPFRGEGSKPPNERTPEEMAIAFNTHPERVTYRQRPAGERPDPRRWALVSRLMGPKYDADLEQALEQVTIPTLVLWGAQDGVIPHGGGHVYRERMPNCTFVLLEDAAHDVQGDQPELSAALVGEFLAHGPDRLAVDARDGRLNPD